MTDFPIKRALLSVSDKSGLIERAKKLADMGVELLSTGGTKKAIADAGIPVKDVADVTKFPEMMDGRVKTLHPVVHGGLLHLRDNDTHVAQAKEHGIEAIDLLYVNLYPFEETVARGADFHTCIENIDIGGPAMLRAAAKNYGFVSVCTDGDDLDAVIADMETNNGATTLALRKKLCAKTYARTGAYDAAISNWYFEQLGEESPEWRAFGGKRISVMRYGENPHQKAAFYKTPEIRTGVATAELVQGKALSYNNINDTDAAFELVSEFPSDEQAAVAIIKHANPCGVALGATPLEAYQKAYDCDRTSAFGGIVALNQSLTEETAAKITEIFTEVVIAPGADEAAKEIFRKKKNLRLLLTDGLADPRAAGVFMKAVAGGLLVQDQDRGFVPRADMKVVTKKQPTEAEWNDLFFAWRVAKHVKSNTIVYAKDQQTAGVGAGQMSRIDSARIATRKALDAQEAAGWAEPKTAGCVAASDAFFPFPDGLLQTAEAGATCVIQPGGSIKDDDVIAAADEAGIAMVFTGMRHFRH